jgi:hypothetical protein
MGKIYTLTLGALVLTGTLFAGSLQAADYSYSSQLLQGVQFGSAPLPAMICIKGTCLDDLAPGERTNRIFAAYNNPVDLTHFGGVAISSPEYDYFEGRLFRIMFRLHCRSGREDSCLGKIIDELDSDYGLTPIPGSPRETDLPPVIDRDFHTDSGLVVRLSWSVGYSDWQRPYVEIYDLPLMESVRSTSNPNYRPNGRW